MNKQYTHIFKDLSMLMELKQKWESGRYGVTELSRHYGVSHSTIRRNLNKLETLK
ncbi:hypothetical protein CKO50_20385 [Pseudoalteromonas sp. HM-SA03]|uniref:DeoR family transcriptional regulator n=1 Tax=Pseudoalteromonas sp. HM-SA03 TaxID=2029678 RepID=UPI000BAE0DFB|nr:DeoR family transcriptional regulator [Pseudoalteromonas sp. HM-SA03]PAX99572.1 hypothetical protein CKO50_20385 [Pseudoalteromonas sp. HM-SA03]